jgi:hypothetical protein
MVVWTVLELLGLILDRTDGEPGRGAGTHRFTPAPTIPNSCHMELRFAARYHAWGRPSPIITVPAAAGWWQTRLAMRLDYSVYRLGLGSSVSADGPPTL